MIYTSNNISKSKARAHVTTYSQFQEHIYNQQTPRNPKIQSETFKNKRKTQTNCTENSSFLQQNRKYPPKRQFNRNQSHYSNYEK